MVRASLREESQGFLTKRSDPDPSVRRCPMTINRLDALLFLQSRKALPKLPLLRRLALCCHEGFLIRINVLAETTSGKSPVRVLRIFRVKPSNLADKPESFVNRHGL
jgi:hypothetical protein